MKINIDLKDFFNEIASHNFLIDGSNWMETCHKLKHHLPQYTETVKDGYIDPNFISEKISEYAPDLTIFVSDVGQNQMRASQSLVLREHHQLLNSG